MSILIKGMEMPKGCFNCRFLDSYLWRCEIAKRKASHSADCVPPYCPIVQVPPHGRLIDADALIFNIGDVPYKGSVRRVLLSAPTIIPAEEE